MAGLIPGLRACALEMTRLSQLEEGPVEPLLTDKDLRPRGLEKLVQGHTTNEQQIRDSNHCLLTLGWV